MKNIAVVLAGGSGSRMGEDYPKQLLKIAGKKVIEHTLDVFEKHIHMEFKLETGRTHQIRVHTADVLKMPRRPPELLGRLTAFHHCRPVAA